MAQNMKPCVPCIYPSEADARIWVASGCLQNEMTGQMRGLWGLSTQIQQIHPKYPKSHGWIHNLGGWSGREDDWRQRVETEITGSCTLRLLLWVLARDSAAGQKQQCLSHGIAFSERLITHLPSILARQKSCEHVWALSLHVYIHGTRLIFDYASSSMRLWCSLLGQKDVTLRFLPLSGLGQWRVDLLVREDASQMITQIIKATFHWQGHSPGTRNLWSNSVCFNCRDQGLNSVLGGIIFALHPFVGGACSAAQLWLFEYMQKCIWATNLFLIYHATTHQHGETENKAYDRWTDNDVQDLLIYSCVQ